MQQTNFQGNAPYNGLLVTGVPPPQQTAFAMNAFASSGPRPVYIPKGGALNSGSVPTSEPPNADYMGDEIAFALPSLDDFERWRASVERTLTVDFVKGDKHSSRSSPKAFLELVKLVCARHSRSGRKPYQKKHPERQRKVPSRKVDDGCPASISYRTFEDKTEVHVVYNPRHSHVTGPENYEFTREGRREAASHRSRSVSRSPQVFQFAELRDDERASTEAPSAPPASFASPYGIVTPLSAPSFYRPLPQVSLSPRTFPQEGKQQSPVSGTPAASPIRPALGLSSLSSPVRAFEMQLPYSPVSESVSPARTSQSLPTPVTGTYALPLQPNTPIRAPQALPTPTYTTQPLPSPERTAHRLGTPLHVIQPLASPIRHTQALHTPHHVSQPLPSPVAHAQHISTPVHHMQPLPQSVHSTPMLNITTELPYVQQDVYSSPYIGNSSLSLQNDATFEQPYEGTTSGLNFSASPDPDSLAIPDGGAISLTITSSPSPSPRTATLVSEDAYSGIDDAMVADDTPAVPADEPFVDLDLRAERWTRIANLFEGVRSASRDVQYTEEMVDALEGVLMRLWLQVQPDAMASMPRQS